MPCLVEDRKERGCASVLRPVAFDPFRAEIHRASPSARMTLPACSVHDPVANPESGSDLSPEAVRELEAEIRALAKEQDAVILAHNYQLPEVQGIADHVGDSLQLAIVGRQVPQSTIVFCGVHFMAESAKVLAPAKRVLLPNLSAGCSLADSITAESLEDWRARYPEHAVVTYVNSTAEVKALSDICCTSANAASVVRSLPQKKIIFTPDRNLGAWVKSKVPEKEIVVYDGCCPVHDVLRSASVERVKRAKPEAVIIAHPECRADVLAMADEVCSTTAMLGAVERHPQARTFIIATEHGIVHQLKLKHPDYMKMVDLLMVREALVRGKHEIRVPDDVADGARRALERMIAVPRDA
jgi:quinolinate synthase